VLRHGCDNPFGNARPFRRPVPCPSYRPSAGTSPDFCPVSGKNLAKFGWGPVFPRSRPRVLGYRLGWFSVQLWRAFTRLTEI
jgi:hypothetical protein